MSEELIFEACETLKCVNISIVVYETYEPEPYEGFEINILKTPDLDPSIVLDPVKARVGIPGGCLGSCDYRGLFESMSACVPTHCALFSSYSCWI